VSEGQGKLELVELKFGCQRYQVVFGKRKS